MKKAILSLLVAVGLISQLNADTLLSGSDNSQGGFMSVYTSGYTFQVGSNSLQVDALGNTGVISYDPASVGLWDSNGTLLTSITLPYNLTAQNFIWNILSSPITLQSGQVYTIGSVGLRGSYQNPRVGVATDLSPYVSIIGGGTWDSRYGATASQLNNPVGTLPYNMNGEGKVVIGPNMQFSVIPNATPSPTPLAGGGDSIPEPSTYALFGLGALVIGVAYRRKAKLV